MSYYAGEASLEEDWEDHPNPRAWIQKVAWNKTKARKLEDEAEYIKANANGIDLESELCEKKNKESGRLDRLGQAINKPDRVQMNLRTSVSDPFAALLPSSKASLEDRHAALDLEKHCREIGLSELATRLALAQFALAKKDPVEKGRVQRIDRSSAG